MKKYPALILLLILFFIPSISIAEDGSSFHIDTGYTLYQYIKLSDNNDWANNYSNYPTVFYVTGYLEGFYSAFLSEQLLYKRIFSFVNISESDLSASVYGKTVGIINLPDEMLVGQLTLIYKKWAENHPEKLNQSPEVCLITCLIDAYGFKR
jgi:hypothetical protein